MNKETAKDYLPLVQALADGKTIQRKDLISNGPGKFWAWKWIDVDLINTSRAVADYRIKPDPREIWIVEHSDSSMSAPHMTPMDAIKDQKLGSTLRRYREVIE